MANIDRANEFPDGIQIGNIGIFSGDQDPSIGGEVAPEGSLYIQTGGKIFSKEGPLNTDWSKYVLSTDNSLSSFSAILINNHKNTTYTNVGRFYFKGTDIVGFITSIDGIIYKSSGDGNYSARVYDITNNNTIAEVTGQTNTLSGQITFGAISNLPTLGAIFEIQTIISQSNRTVYCDSVTITYGET